MSSRTYAAEDGETIRSRMKEISEEWKPKICHHSWLGTGTSRVCTLCGVKMQDLVNRGDPIKAHQ